MPEANDPRNAEVGQPEPAEQETQEADAAEHVLGSMAVARQKLDGEQIEKPFDEPADAVFRFAKAPRPMVDRNFADAEAAGRRQDRDEAMQFAIEPHFAQHLRAIALHAAIVIV